MRYPLDRLTGLWLFFAFAGDAIVLIHGVHAIRVVEDMQCISVKQGPFFGDKLDKVNVSTK